ncbi:MAG: hypothetical protein OXF26_14670 [Alphaproteobacteria bacterium]|nr:hypothetical protein [Alphaproteobacteria bacterium]
MTRAALRAALLVAALAFPAAAQDAPLVVKIVSDTSNDSRPFTEGGGGLLYRVKIKGDGVAPKGGIGRPGFLDFDGLRTKRRYGLAGKSSDDP